ncbi:hypothetical protein ACT7CW_29885 [Bacillus pacificus]
MIESIKDTKQINIIEGEISELKMLGTMQPDSIVGTFEQRKRCRKLFKEDRKAIGDEIESAIALK